MGAINELNEEQLERLALVSEELGEAQAKIGKILRHGYESTNPTVNDGMTNREDLERELADVLYSIRLLAEAGDVSATAIEQRFHVKAKSVQRWLHHQDGDLLNMAASIRLDMDVLYKLYE